MGAPFHQSFIHTFNDLGFATHKASTFLSTLEVTLKRFITGLGPQWFGKFLFEQISFHYQSTARLEHPCGHAGNSFSAFACPYKSSHLALDVAGIAVPSLAFERPETLLSLNIDGVLVQEEIDLGGRAADF